MRRKALLSAAAALALACGGSDDGATSGTCDFTQVATKRTCLEQTGSAADVAGQRAACESHAGTWTSASCPVNGELLGCCAYDLGLAFRECFYAYPERSYDPQSLCTSTTFNGTPGAWTPAP